MKQKSLPFLALCLLTTTLIISAALTNMAKAKGLEDVKSNSFDSLSSKKELGCTVKGNSTTFRVFAPRATAVTVVVFTKCDDTTGDAHEMHRDNDGVWEFTSKGVLYGKYYAYSIDGPRGKGEMFNTSILVADPYSKAVATQNNYHQPARTLILDTHYDWRGDSWVIPKDHNSLVIYETHMRDLTADPTSGVKQPGTYAGAHEKGAKGGISYVKNLGVNAVEFLPLQKFGLIELPYRDSSVNKFGYPTNNWNYYARNHWGYMTSAFFAPENYYGSDGTIEAEKWIGTDGRAVKEMKDMVKAYHKEGIAVIMDVVFNHVSEYDFNMFKYIDKMYYFRTDSNGNFQGQSGCGNDFATERPMSRRFIVDCISYWMKEYHIDGFRFDLAAMIDWQTCTEIYKEARSINPNVFLTAEPWGAGKYEIAHFSDIGWASWNDQIRNGVKGQNPNDGLGFIFGKYQGGNTRRSLDSYVKGTLREDGGLYVKQEHSVNYLESHDDNSFGDFIRLGLRDVKEHDVIADVNKNAQLTPKQLALNKLGAMFLFTAQGPIMLGEGQEYARSKVIAKSDAPDPRVGTIDHNTYDKDNATNYLNYDHAAMNAELVDYYRGLIALRKTYPVFGSAPLHSVDFLPTVDSVTIAFTLSQHGPGKNADFVVVMNGNPGKGVTVGLPSGTWKILANADAVDLSGKLGTASDSITVPASSGTVLVNSKTQKTNHK